MSIDRGIFLVPWGGLDARRLAEQASEASANFVSISVKDSMGRAWVRSDVVPTWQIDGDPFAVAAESMHDAGLELHASVAVFADAFVGQRNTDALAVGQDGVTAARPGWDEDWYYHLCPTRSEQRERTLAFVVELLDRYQIDALELDFIRFPWKAATSRSGERRFCFCRMCKEAFELETGASMRDLGTNEVDDMWYAWRASRITTLIEEVVSVASRCAVPVSPFVAFWGSEALGGEELAVAQRRFGQDHAALGRLCHRLSPMLYHEFTGEPTCFTERSKRWVADITAHLRDQGSSVCTVVQGGPPANPLDVLDVVRGAFDAGADAIMSYPGLSWSVENAYFARLGEAYCEIASAGHASPVV